MLATNSNHNMWLFRLCLVLILPLVCVSQDIVIITGKIISCSADRLNHHKELRSFLNDHLEAEEYRGVTIEEGQEDTHLHIYHNETFQERIDLQIIPVKEEMHIIMLAKGFVKMSMDEIREMKTNKYAIDRAKRRKYRDERVSNQKRRNALLLAKETQQWQQRYAILSAPITRQGAVSVKGGRDGDQLVVTSKIGSKISMSSPRPLTYVERIQFDAMRKLMTDADAAKKNHSSTSSPATKKIILLDDEPNQQQQPLQMHKTSLQQGVVLTMIDHGYQQRQVLRPISKLVYSEL